MSLDRRIFQNPTAEYRGAPFWSWNDRLQPRELVRQIRLMHKGGWGGFFMHSRIGLLTEYLGEEWMECVRACVEEAKRLDMKAWLYDEDRWPSGYAGGRVPEKQPAARARALVCQERSQPAPPESSLVAAIGEHSFYEVLHPREAWFNGWSYVDLMNPEAVRAFLDESYEPYARRFARELGGTVPGVFTDEPCNNWCPGRWPRMIPWTPALPSRFQQQWGYDLMPHLASLFFEEGEFHRIRYHFWRTALELFCESFSRQVGAWCAEHKLTLTGHYMAEDGLGYQLEWITAAMPHYEFMQQPGMDHLSRNIESVLTAKQCASVANQLGQPRRLSEMYGCSGQNLSFEDRKWIGDWHLVLGINFVCHHLALYSMKGCRKRDYPPNLFYQQPWWPENRIVDDYLARLCYVLSQGRPLTDILVLHPQESAWCLYRPGTNPPDPIAPYEESIVALSHHLLSLQRQFDYGDESILSRHGRVENGRFKVGQMDYRLVILPSVFTLRRSTVRLLQEFLAQGGEVWSVGKFPERIEAEPEAAALADLEKQILRVENKRECLRAALERALPSELAYEGSGSESLWVAQREIEGRRLLFLSNLSRRETARGTVRWATPGGLERWDAVTGRVESVATSRRGDVVATDVLLPPTGSLLLATTSAAAALQADGPPARATSVFWPLLPQWEIQRLDPNALTLDFCRYQIAGSSGWSEEIPVIGLQELLNERKYVGPLALQFRFHTQRFLNRNVQIAVAIEEAPQWDVRVNGRSVRYEGLPFYRDISFLPIDISLLVNEGENLIELRRSFEHADPTSYRDQARRYGTELEAIYLIGDFCVRGTPSPQPLPVNPHHQQWGLPVLPLVRYQPQWTLADDKQVVDTGDLVPQGYPFFAGRLILNQRVNIAAPRPGERVWFEVDRLDSIVLKVRLNGFPCGDIVWPPYRAELTEHVQEGENLLEVELVSSLRNLLGPHHNSRGELVSVGPDDFSGRGGWSQEGDPDWLERRAKGAARAWTDDYFLVPFGLHNPVVHTCAPAP